MHTGEVSIRGVGQSGTARVNYITPACLSTENQEEQCVSREISPFLFKVPNRVLPGCVSGHRVSLPEKTAQPGIRVPRMPECRGLSSLPSPRHRGRDYGPCLGIAGHRQTDTLHYTKLPSWHPILMTVAGELYLCPKFHSDLWNRTEDGLEVPGKLLRMDQVPQLYYSLCFLATSYLCGLF